MSGLPETMYCSQQIHISPMLPQILKQYAKSAIRTQPTDLLRWSAAYFRALSQNETPPEKKRLEYPEPKNYMGLTPGLLKVLLRQIGKSPDIMISYPDLYVRWDGICMPQEELIKILLSAQIDNAITMPWFKIIAVAAGYLSDNLTQTMVLICNLLTEEPDGGSAMIPVDVFLKYYKFLAELNLSETKYMLNVFFYVSEMSDESRKKQQTDVPINLTKIDTKPKLEAPDKTDRVSIVSNVPPEFENIFRNQVPAKQSRESEGFVVDQESGQIIQKQEGKSIVTETAKISKPTDLASSISQTQSFSISEIIGEHDLSQEIPSSLSLNENEETFEIREGEEESHLTENEIAKSDQTLQSNQTIQSNGGDKGGGFSPNLPQNDDEHHREVINLESPYSNVESVTSKFLGRCSPHFHLNKYMASATPSMLTELESRFTTADISSETHTIFREEVAKPKGLRLIVKLPSEQVRYEIEEVKGVGPAVDPETMNTFIKYIEERAAFQHGMIMPRNITSFQCPPLENFKYMKKIEVEEDIPFVGCKNVY